MSDDGLRRMSIDESREYYRTTAYDLAALMDEQAAELSTVRAQLEAAVRERDEARFTRDKLTQTVQACPEGHHDANLAHARVERDALRIENRELRAERDALLDLRAAAVAWRDVGTGSRANLIDQARVHNALRAAVDALGDVTPRSET